MIGFTDLLIKTPLSDTQQRVSSIEGQTGNISYLSTTYSAIARLFIKKNQLKDALSYLTRVDELDHKNTSLVSKADHAYAYVEYYEARKDHKKAFEYQRIFQHVNDSINSKRSADRFVEYEALYGAEKKGQEIEMLNQEKQHKDDQIKIQQSQLARSKIIITFAIILLLILVPVFITRHRY